MEEYKNVYYKARLYVDEEGKLHGITVTNHQIPSGLQDALSKAMHEVVDSFNGKQTWRELYIKFTDNGKRYEQFDSKHANFPCFDCVFYGDECQHPHYYDGTKGRCEKPYREVKEKNGEIVMELKDYTTEELRAELKKRNAEERAKKASVLRCRMCKHWGAIDYWGNPRNYTYYGRTQSCKFFKTKNGKNYRCHNASQLACENFERKED